MAAALLAHAVSRYGTPDAEASALGRTKMARAWTVRALGLELVAEVAVAVSEVSVKRSSSLHDAIALALSGGCWVCIVQRASVRESESERERESESVRVNDNV